MITARRWAYWTGLLFLGAGLGRAISQSYWITTTLVLVGTIFIILAPITSNIESEWGRRNAP